MMSDGLGKSGNLKNLATSFTISNSNHVCNFFFFFFCLLLMGVHKPGRIGFVPNIDLSRMFRVGENQNRNQSVLMVESSGSGSSSFGFVSIGFGFCRRCRYFTAGADIWLDWLRFGQYLVRSIKSKLDLDEISPNLTGFGRFQIALC